MDLSRSFNFFEFFLNESLLVGAALCWLICISQALIRWRRAELLISAPLTFFFGLSLVIAFFHTSSIIRISPWLTFTFIPVYFIFIPLEAAFFKMILGYPLRISAYQVYHFIPFVLSIVFLWPFFNLEDPRKLDTWFYWLHYSGSSLNFKYPILLIVFAAGDFLHNIYLLPVFQKSFYIYRQSKIDFKDVSFMLHVSLAVVMISKLIATVAFIMHSVDLYRINLAVSGIAVIPFLWTAMRFPKVMYAEFVKAKEWKKVRDYYSDEEHKRLAERIKQTVITEKAFLDEDLTLPQLAHELGVSSRSISVALNSVIGMNFNQFVNYQRVEEAKMLLLNNPHDKVITITYAVGFNSKSAFYDAFVKHAGKSPKQYRLDHFKK